MAKENQNQKKTKKQETKKTEKQNDKTQLSATTPPLGCAILFFFGFFFFVS